MSSYEAPFVCAKCGETHSEKPDSGNCQETGCPGVVIENDDNYQTLDGF